MSTNAMMKVPTIKGKRWFKRYEEEAISNEKIVNGCNNERSKLNMVL
jgi:hypothetical protein